MIGVSVKTIDNTRAVVAASDKAAFRNFGHAAARISKDAKASIITSDEPSEPGDPPHTRAQSGHNLRVAIRYDATKQDAVIGPRASVIGEVGRLHEFGGIRGSQHFPERPFMRPALEANLSRFAREWEGSIS